MNPASDVPRTGDRPGGELRRQGGRWATSIAEFGLRTIASSALLLLGLIFVFVGREALPVALGRLDSVLVRDALPVSEALHLPPEQLRVYLGLTPGEFARLDTRALRELASLRVEAQTNLPPALREDPDARVNTLSWRYLLRPHAWSGHEQPAYVWQPIAPIRKFNLLPLFVGTAKIALVSLVVAVPLALLAALYVSQLAPPAWRDWIKPGIESIAAIPTVAIGFLALAVLAGFLEGPCRAIAGFLGVPVSRLNAVVAGTALGFALVPVVFAVAEDALTAVPRAYTQAALALGATRWQAATGIVVPSAFPGLCAAVVLGLGRAMSETMIVLMASGNAAVMSWDLFQPARTATATIAAEMAEAVFGGHHYRVLFLIGFLLLATTFATNLMAEAVMRRFHRRLPADL